MPGQMLGQNPDSFGVRAPGVGATSLNVNFRPLGDSSNVRSTSPLTVALKQGDSAVFSK